MSGSVRCWIKYLSKKKGILFIIIAASLLSLWLFPGCGDGLSILTEDPSVTPEEPQVPEDPWDDYSYRRSITISNEGSTIYTNYQVNIILDRSNFEFNNSDPDGNDIRFYYNENSIPYWIESWDSSAQNASVWVNVPAIANPDTVIYMYYGNEGETSESDFDNTFTKDSGFSGLAARWHMDEGTGSIIHDSSSNFNDGIINNAAWAGADGGGWYNRGDVSFSTGDSLVFDSNDYTNDYVTVPDSPSLDVTSITIATWVKTSDNITSTQCIVSKWGTGVGAYSLIISCKKIYFVTGFSNNSCHIQVTSSEVDTNRWYHLAATFNGSAKVIYINGEPRKISCVCGRIKNSCANLSIGSDITPVNFFKGIIDEVSIYNTALSEDEVKALSGRRKFSTDICTMPTVGSEEFVP